MNYLFLALILPLIALCGELKAEQNMVLIPEGTFVPFVLKSNTQKGEELKFQREPVKVQAFWMDPHLVTNEDFLRFVRSHPERRKTRIKHIFADPHYLEKWKSDLKISSPRDSRRPVTQVSWFAAKAFCEDKEKRLPTTDEWEYVLTDNGRKQPEIKDKLLTWYGKPNTQTLPTVGSTGKNGFGVFDIVGVVWEWTLDFNNFLAGEEMRSSGGKDSGLFCGGGSLGTIDASDYAAFMRYSFRASLKASYTTSNLGFRCVKEK